MYRRCSTLTMYKDFCEDKLKGSTDPVVQLTQNCGIKGQVVSHDSLKKPCYRFLGIPYADQPVGSLRFKPPQELKLWSGIKPCREFGPICPQDKQLLDPIFKVLKDIKFTCPYYMDEGCLYMNIWTTSVNEESTLKPVLLWIYGGGFILGFSDFYDGAVLAANYDVVVVTFNYRVGPFGFMSTEDGSIKGNMGLLDQVEAMKWVQKYIKAFGGDPNNVTIFGESAGGVCIGYHLVSPLSKGLFNRAIMQSGSPCTQFVKSKETATSQCYEHLKKIGYTKELKVDVLTFLSSMTWQEIYKQIGCGHSFFPIIKDEFFFPDFPTRLYEADLFNKDVDVMMGFNTDDGYDIVEAVAAGTKLTSKELLEKALDTGFKEILMTGLPNVDEKLQQVKDMYLSEVTTQSEDDLTKLMSEICCDALFTGPLFMCAKFHSNKGVKKPYVYEFGMKLNFNTSRPSWVKSGHADDVYYVTGDPVSKKLFDSWSQDEEEFSKRIMQLWTSFAQTGIPMLNGEEVWSPTTDDEYLDLVSLIFHKSYKPEQMALWKEIWTV